LKADKEVPRCFWYICSSIHPVYNVQLSLNLQLLIFYAGFLISSHTVHIVQ
jgi:hypothetical protein